MTNKVEYKLLHPTYKSLYDIVGEANLLKIYELFRGTQLQLPMKMYDRNSLSKAILNGRLDDMSVQEISLKYGYSPRWIKRIRERE